MLLIGLSYYLQTNHKINTLTEIKKFYGLYGLYFLSFLGIFLIWAISNPFNFLGSFVNNYVTLTFAFVFDLIFLQKYVGNYMGLEISNPLTSLSDVKKYIYYVGVFISVAWFIFVILIAIGYKVF